MAGDSDLRSSWLLIEHILSRSSAQVLWLICSMNELVKNKFMTLRVWLLQVEVDADQVQAAVKVLELHKIDHVITEWFLETFKRDLYNTVAPNFWNNFQSPIAADAIITHVCKAFETLYAHLKSYNVSFERIGGIHSLQKCSKPLDIKSEAQLLLKAVVFSSTTRSFQDAMLEFYSQSFKAFDSSTSDNKGSKIVWSSVCFRLS